MAEACVAALLAMILCSSVSAQLLTYPDPSLDSIYPAGAQQGTTVEVELRGLNGLTGANELLIDGLPGVTASQVKATAPDRVTATLTVAADAAPGRRQVRIKGGANGLTNFRSFFVGRLPEVVESETPRNDDQPNEVPTPVVINGRLDPALDVDSFRFQGRKGQKIVAAGLAHRIDSLTRQYYNRGLLDLSLELLDAQGAILALAEDTLGLDPLISMELPADGMYTIRVRGLMYQGFPQAVYRLTLGELPYPTAVFPSGGQRGQSVEATFVGPNVPPGVRQIVADQRARLSPIQDISLEALTGGEPVLPFVWGEHPELVEAEPNDKPEQATAAALPCTINGRLVQAGDQDWIRIHLAKGEGIVAQTMAQRHLFSPVDTSLEIRDAAGKSLAQNDDGRRFSNECLHDFAALDSWLAFTAPQDGDYFVVVKDESGTPLERSVYRLTLEPLKPDFQILQWPDAVPIWGPASTSAFVVQVLAWGGLNSDVELQVVDLPSGWTGSVTRVPGATFASYNGTEYGIKALLTITAPPEAPLGALASFRVVGRAEQDGRTLERIAQPLSLLGNSHNDRMHLRFSDQSRVVVTSPLGARLETPLRELEVVQGREGEIPVRVVYGEGEKPKLSLTLDGQTVAASVAWRSPVVVGAAEEIRIPFTVDASRPPGIYSVVVSCSWGSDLRNGRPGPCTPIIQLRVLPASN